jgi:hypothetical protein
MIECKEHLKLHTFQISNTTIQHIKTTLYGISVVPTSQIRMPTMMILLMTSIKMRWSQMA